jgi:hypothetical protein
MKMENNLMGRHYHSSNGRAMKILKIIGMVFVGVIFAVLFALVFGFLVKWLWNVLMPELFGLTQITYWQAFGIVVLAKLLFGTFGSKGQGPDHGSRHPGPFGKWHDRFHGSEEGPRSRRSGSWKTYRQYWQEEGKGAFDAYMRRKDKEGEAGNGPPIKISNGEEHDA